MHRLPFAFFVPATLLAAWYGGYWPGFAAYVGGLVLGDYFFLEPHNALGSLSSAGRLSLGIYTITCISGVGLLELLHVTNQRLERRGAAPATAVADSEPGASLYLERLLNFVERFALTVPEKRSVVARYGVAVGAVAIGFALRYLESEEIIHRLAFVFFMPATFFAAWYGGLGPGLVALVGGLLLANYFFLPPHPGVIPVRLFTRTGAIVYALTCLVWMGLLELMFATHRRIEREQAQAPASEASSSC
jgi:K+-sensing histidine kinase KdpD